MLTVCYQAALSVLSQIPRQTANQKDSKITNYLGILRRLGPLTSSQTEKPLVSEQVKLESRRAWTAVVQILRMLETWFSPLRLQCCSREEKCSALDF